MKVYVIKDMYVREAEGKVVDGWLYEDDEDLTVFDEFWPTETLALIALQVRCSSAMKRIRNRLTEMMKDS